MELSWWLPRGNCMKMHFRVAFLRLLIPIISLSSITHSFLYKNRILAWPCDSSPGRHTNLSKAPLFPTTIFTTISSKEATLEKLWYGLQKGYKNPRNLVSFSKAKLHLRQGLLWLRKIFLINVVALKKYISLTVSEYKWCVFMWCV